MSEDRALTWEEKRKLVLELYKQGKRRKEIAKKARMSFTDIKRIIDKEYGSQLEKNQAELSNYSRALKLFLGGAKPVKVAIKLGLPYEDVREIYMQFLSLNRMHKLKQVYDELGDNNIKPFLRFYDKLKENDFGIERISDVVNYAGSLHELEAKHSTLCNQIQELVFQIQNSSSTAQQLENQIQDAKSRLDYCNYELQIKEKELAVLDSAINRKKRIIQRLDNSGGYSRIKEAAKKEAESILQNHHVLLTLLVSIVLESVKRYPANQELIYELTFGSATPNQSMMELHKTQLLQTSKHIHAELLARITRITTDDMENTIAG